MQQTMAFLQIDASSMSVPTGNLDVRKARPCLKSLFVYMLRVFEASRPMMSKRVWVLAGN